MIFTSSLAMYSLLSVPVAAVSNSSVRAGVSSVLGAALRRILSNERTVFRSRDQSGPMRAKYYLEQRLSGLPGQERQKLTVGVVMLGVILSKVTIRVI